VSESFLSGSAASDVAGPLIDAEVALRLDDHAEARRLFDIALAQGRTPSERVAALEGLGQVAYREGRNRDAVELLEQALAESGRDISAFPSLADTLARAYAGTGQLAPAIAILSRCVDFFDEIGDSVQYVRFAGLVGCALTDNGDFRAAERMLASALARGRDILDPYTRARLYWSQSRLLLEEGRPDLAEQYARKTVDTLRATEDTYAVAHALESLAHIQLELSRPVEALALLEEGAPWIAAAGTPVEVAHFRIEEARAHAAMGDSDRALAIAEEIADQLGDGQSVSRARLYTLLGDLFAQSPNEARARELYRAAIELLEQSPPNRHLVDAYKRLAALLKTLNERDEALELLERALAVQEQMVPSLT